MGENKVYKSFIGLGYYETITPGVILRNVQNDPTPAGTRPTLLIRRRSLRVGCSPF
eukprot:gene34178-44158_t